MNTFTSFNVKQDHTCPDVDVFLYKIGLIFSWKEMSIIASFLCGYRLPESELFFTKNRVIRR